MTPTRALIEAAEACMKYFLPLTQNEAEKFQALRAAISSAKAAEEAESSDDLYYIQDKRSYCGNSCFWWKPNGNGYTCNLDEAWKVSREKAESITRHRPYVDVAWPVAVIDAGTAHHFDMQKLRDIRPLSR